ncbi:MAG: Rpn family recombination-promoting nuclease/putative transposase, partial [Gemmatimonadetes bacterium]|nr:Rpn family recombination-promoting nuclease/putative transposase [Gemmatimonadota bacterium]
FAPTPPPPWSPHHPGDSMHDAFLKSVFSDRRMVEILIYGHAPEWAAKIDFSTLREESTGLVSKKTLQRRHPDMIWSADTVDGERVLFLMEFQRTAERLMALRTTTYTALTLEGIAAGPDFRPGDPLPEFVYLVLYHGEGPWTAPANVADLFQHSDPGRYRLVPWREGTGNDRSRDDLTALVLGLARNLSPEDMAVQLSGLWRVIERHGDPGLTGLMVQTVDTMLELRDYPARLTKEGAKTMAEVVDRFQQGMDELVQKCEARVLRRQVTRRFGEETAGKLSRLLDELPGPEDVDRVTDALVECATGDEFIERVRMG